MRTPTDTMLFLNYTPRSDVDARGYDVWVRDIDNLFWSNTPGIAHYTNWKIARTLVGALPFTHFDFMFLDEIDGFGKVFGREDAQAFAKGWSDDWGRLPQSEDPADNAHIHRCAPVAVPSSGFVCDRTLLLATSARRDGADDAAYDAWLAKCGRTFVGSLPGVEYVAHWRIAESIIGTDRFTDIDVVLVDPAVAAEELGAADGIGEFASLWRENWGARPGAALGESIQIAACSLISAPH